jgi:predicted Zn-dependent peptidase
MRHLTIFAAFFLFATLTFAEKAPLPKDLPAYGPEKPLKGPAVNVSKLDNGLSVWLVSQPGFPKIAFSLAVHGGMASDPKDRPGISDLLATTIDQGTKTRSARQIAEEIQAAGGDLSTGSGKDSTVMSTEVLSQKGDAAIALIADVIQNATFPENEVALAKKNLSDSLRQQESDPDFLANRQMAKILFGDDPYHVTSPTQESIAASTPDDLRKVYLQRFRPDEAVLVAVGDFQNDKMLAQIKAAFGTWKASNQPPIAIPKRFTNTMQPTVFLVPRPDSVQTSLRLGSLGPTRSDADYAASDVANAIFGGTFGSRLTLNIREDKGYTYSPYSTLRTYIATGILTAEADVRNEVTGASFNEMSYELNRMVTTNPTEEELATARRFLVGLEAIRFQIRSAVAGELSKLWIYGMSPDEITRYGEQVTAVTAADVDTAAKKYFPARRQGIVVVGEEKVIRDAFEPFGFKIEVVQ